ncbi:MAG: hypothetical protein QOC66_4021 [Pseudonocardiales bacterium]|nr:hypothetical protein [Pseudonocardiales bacterium]
MTSRSPLTGPPRAHGAERYRRLLEAHHAISDDRSLTSVLDRTVRAACELVDTEYGAVGIIGADGSLEHIAHRGLDDETVGRIGRLPRSGGMLRASLAVPGPIRLDDLTADPRYYGLPAHPTMRSFLGVPIQSRGVVLGELYLADPLPGRFDAEDEELVVSLATTAGNAVENSRLYDEARRSRDWLNASGEIARALLADEDEEVLLDVVTRALSVAQADLACLILPTGDQRLQVAVAKGVGAASLRRRVLDPAESTMARTVIAAQSMRTHDMTLWANLDFDNRHDFGPAMIVPLLDAQGSRGAMLMVRRRQGLPFTLHDVDLASTFAAQVALAMELNDTRAEAEWVRVLEDRHRIAHDLHDNVMQRLFATGVGLQALAEQQPDGPLAERLRRHIADLDETIDEIRGRIFGLRDDDGEGLRRRRNRFPHVGRAAAATVRGMGGAAVRSLTPRSRRRDQSPGVTG